jgi:poly-beta-1,6-N-acetyl-D-glucosamine synthase
LKFAAQKQEEEMKTELQQTGSPQRDRDPIGGLKYVLITPARNEADYIELTIKSMVAQTVRPLKWVVVSDGSTDGTDEIVNKYLPDNPWIELLRMPERKERHFAGKVHAFNAGYARVNDLDYDVIGNLDGDVAFDAEYYEFLLGKFAENSQLGVVGTPFKEGSFQYDYNFTSIEHVSGQCQLFRRKCFEDIGGYLPRRIGGIDSVAVMSARMKGWKTRTFVEKTFDHFRPMGSATENPRKAAFKLGRADYILGTHPVWQFFRCVYKMTKRPYVVSGSICLAGFVWAAITRAEKDVPEDMVKFRRAEEMRRSRAIMKRMLTGSH